MHLSDNHLHAKNISSKLIFTASTGKVMSIHMTEDSLLAEHTSPVHALLMCVVGKVSYDDQSGKNIQLTNGEYVEIEPQIVHRVTAHTDSQLLLIR